MFPKVDFCPNIPYELLTPNHLLYDLLYNPNVTPVSYTHLDVYKRQDIRQAYLFEENGHWYAYEHSANRIEKFVKAFVDFNHKVQDVCGRIKIEIDLNVLEKCSVTLCEDSLLILDCPTA